MEFAKWSYLQKYYPAKISRYTVFLSLLFSIKITLHTQWNRMFIRSRYLHHQRFVFSLSLFLQTLRYLLFVVYSSWMQAVLSTLSPTVWTLLLLLPFLHVQPLPQQPQPLQLGLILQKAIKLVWKFCYFMCWVNFEIQVNDFLFIILFISILLFMCYVYFIYFVGSFYCFLNAVTGALFWEWWCCPSHWWCISSFATSDGNWRMERWHGFGTLTVLCFIVVLCQTV